MYHASDKHVERRAYFWEAFCCLFACVHGLPHLKIRIVPTCQELWIKEVGTKYTESPSITVGARRHLIDH